MYDQYDHQTTSGEIVGEFFFKSFLPLSLSLSLSLFLITQNYHHIICIIIHAQLILLFC